MIEDRLIGEYTAGRPGPMIISLVAVHGNEPAGVKASELMLKMLEVEPITNSNFEFHGTFISILGNLQAYNSKKRFIRKDMNRSWHHERVEEIMKLDKDTLHDEEKEIREVMELIHQKVEQYQPEKVVLIDLHTTSSESGIFSIPNDTKESIYYASKMNAPVIKDMLRGIHGTTLNYFISDNFDFDIVCVVFESGQHNDPQSINRAIAALTNLMGATKSFDEKYIANRHNAILDEYSSGLPRMTRLIDKFHIDDIKKFDILPGFKNFQPVAKGQQIATYDGDPVLASDNSLILMPLYQTQGEEGFFLVKEVE